jgi:hypothetical protein
LSDTAASSAEGGRVDYFFFLALVFLATFFVAAAFFAFFAFFAMSVLSMRMT